MVKTFRKKPFKCKAEQYVDGRLPEGVVLEGTTAWLPGKREPATEVHPGNWVLSFDNGFRCVLTDEFLHEQYEEDLPAQPPQTEWGSEFPSEVILCGKSWREFDLYMRPEDAAPAPPRSKYDTVFPRTYARYKLDGSGKIETKVEVK